MYEAYFFGAFLQTGQKSIQQMIEMGSFTRLYCVLFANSLQESSGTPVRTPVKQRYLSFFGYFKIRSKTEPMIGC